jgi:hypothetical protein
MRCLKCGCDELVTDSFDRNIYYHAINNKFRIFNISRTPRSMIRPQNRKMKILKCFDYAKNKTIAFLKCVNCGQVYGRNFLVKNNKFPLKITYYGTLKHIILI